MTKKRFQIAEILPWENGPCLLLVQHQTTSDEHANRLRRLGTAPSYNTSTGRVRMPWGCCIHCERSNSTSRSKTLTSPIGFLFYLLSTIKWPHIWHESMVCQWFGHGSLVAHNIKSSKMGIQTSVYKCSNMTRDGATASISLESRASWKSCCCKWLHSISILWQLGRWNNLQVAGTLKRQRILLICILDFFGQRPRFGATPANESLCRTSISERMCIRVNRPIKIRLIMLCYESYARNELLNIYGPSYNTIQNCYCP